MQRMRSKGYCLLQSSLVHLVYLVYLVYLKLIAAKLIFLVFSSVLDKFGFRDPRGKNITDDPWNLSLKKVVSLEIWVKPNFSETVEKSRLAFVKFGQSVLKNGWLGRLKSFPPVLVSPMGIYIYIIKSWKFLPTILLQANYIMTKKYETKLFIH